MTSRTAGRYRSPSSLAVPSTSRRPSSNTASRVAMAVSTLLFAAAVARSAQADDQSQGTPAPGGSDQIETVTVTGSLIPQAKDRPMVSTPVLSLSAEDLQNNGFTTIADALQQSSISTGGVEGPQFNEGFTPGAQTLSLFGLDPSYTKYLIDGKPMGNYPALYNGSENFNNIAGIPIELVDHIDILPGGQSSLYGSDAIAGVINIVLKKKLDAPVADIKYGWTGDGGGSDKRFALADSVSFGALTVLGGAQYERTAPIWGYQRPLTSQYFTGGTGPQTAEQDYLVYGLQGNVAYLEDPNNCTKLSPAFGGNIGLQTLPNGGGQYCGTTTAGYYTIDNGDSGIQGYMHATYDLNDHVQFYVDTLLNHDVVSSSSGAFAYNNLYEGNDPAYEFYDPAIGDYMEVQHIFSPQEAGGLGNTMNEDITNAFRISAGAQGSIASSDWTYDASFTYDEQKLDERFHMLFTSEVEAFFDQFLGPNLGPDPNGLGVNSYEPDWAQFYQPVTPAEYNSFSGYITSYSYTEDSLARGQLTNADLFHLPGGDAGIALVAEGGDEGWNYAPNPDFLDGTAYAYTATAGSGHRSRYAGTLELRLPVAPMLTLTGSGRYDDYIVTGGDFDKLTYNAGLEFKPIQMLTFRGRYGTAFKAPTLADEFQGPSGYYETVTDYYNCEKLGYTGANLSGCPNYYLNYTAYGVQSGNTALKPITANVWDGGLIFQPLSRLTITSDYMHWSINDEVTTEDPTLLLTTDAACLLGQLPANSTTCVQAESQVQRDSLGDITQLNTPKINASNETVNAVLTTWNYVQPAGRFGTFSLGGSWQDTVKHTIQVYPGDPTSFYDILANPIYWPQQFKSKENLTLTWDIAKFSATVYVNRYGQTPNYLASVYGYNSPSNPNPLAGNLSSWTIANLSLRYQLTQGLLLQFTADNIGNTMPPVDHTYPGTTDVPYNIFNYNIYGREFFVEATYKFIK